MSIVLGLLLLYNFKKSFFNQQGMWHFLNFSISWAGSFCEKKYILELYIS